MAVAGNAITFTLKESKATTVVLTGTKSDGSLSGSANVTLTSGTETKTITATVNSGEFSKDFTIGGLTPATTYTVTYSGDIAPSGNVTSVTTLVDNPKIATEAQWQDLANRVNNKQDKLTAGSNITISGNTISATGGAPAPITLTLTPDQQNELAFTWTGATIAQIETAFNAGTLILLSRNNVFLMVTNASFYTFQSRRRAVLSVYGPQGQAADYTLDSDGSGDVEIRQFSALTLSTTDIGEGATLAANTLYGVYE